MSIDIQDWSGRLFGCDDNTQQFVTEQWREFVRAVIADEAAKPDPGSYVTTVVVDTGAAQPKRTTRDFAEVIEAMLDKDPALKSMVAHYAEESKKAEATPQPVAEVPATPTIADIPPWFMDLAQKLHNDGLTCGKNPTGPSQHRGWMPIVRDEWPKLLRIIDSHIAEAVAAKDKRIGELEAEVATLSHPAKTRYTRGVKSLSHIVFLKTKLSDAKCEIDYIKEQLAAAQAEVARQKMRQATLAKRDAELANVRAEMERLNTLTNRLNDDNAKLREEVARLSRPVDSVKCGSAATFNQELWVVPHQHFLAERNAREAAERERDELREFVNRNHVWRGGTWQGRHTTLNDGDIEKAMKGHAAFRAEKGTVVT